MWIQIVKTRLKPGKDAAEISALMDQLKATEQPDSGLVRSIATRDQKDPNSLYLIAMFESEEKARVRENDPARQQSLQPVRQTMAEIFADTPQFIDLEVLAEHSGT